MVGLTLGDGGNLVADGAGNVVEPELGGDGGGGAGLKEEEEEEEVAEDEAPSCCFDASGRGR
jgi:hypothetical protein